MKGSSVGIFFGTSPTAPLPFSEGEGPSGERMAMKSYLVRLASHREAGLKIAFMGIRGIPARYGG
jgi:hypothetical protein